jgi:hypothetical protein
MTQDIVPHDRSTAPNTSSAPSPRLKNKRKKQNSLIWLEEPYNRTRGEMALWVAVITQAMMDALSRARNAEAQYHKNEAIHWLTSNSKDFVMVCLCAGMDPDYVRRQAKRTLLKPVAWRAEAGKGKRYLERKAYRTSKKKLSKAPYEKKSCEPYNEPTEACVITLSDHFSSCR